MKIKTGDTVTVITGKDKGKSGKVLRAFPRDMVVIVEGLNIRKRHQRPTRQGSKGQIVEKPHPIHVSNVKKSDAVSEPKKKATKKKSEKKAE